MLRRYTKVKATKPEERGGRESERSIVCAKQRIAQEGLSPSGAQMRGAVSEGGGNASLAGERKKILRSLNGHEGESRIQPRWTWSQSLRVSGGAGCPS